MELLEYLCIGTDCVFISDLRECTRFHSYTTGKALTFSKVEEASEYLKNLTEEDRQ